jgi:hypothetical protein
MEPEDVLIRFTADNSHAIRASQQVMAQLNQLEGPAQTFGQALRQSGLELSGVLGLAKDLSLVSVWGKFLQDQNAVMKSMTSIRSSAGLTNEEFDNLNTSISLAAAATGENMGVVADNARNLFAATGLSKDLGNAVIDSERMSKVFGISAESAGKLTARMIQFGDGIITADTVMKSFDRTTGLTGSRMEDMLDHLNDMAKTLRNIVGGGDQFAKAMKGTIEFTTKMGAEFTKMGGSADDFKDIQKAILDPHKWNDIASKMPGMAGNLVQMQEAMAAGDTERFTKLLQQGARDTVSMGSGMSVIARSASGIDFSSAEMLTKIDFKAMTAGMTATESVMKRNAEQIRDLSTAWGQFTTNISAAFMRVFGPAIDLVSMGLAKLNSVLAGSHGWFLDLTIVIAVVVGSLFALWVAFKKGVELVAEATAKAATVVGQGLGDALAAFAKGAAEAALPLMGIGAALLLAGVGFYFIGMAIQAIGNVDYGKIFLGIGMFIVVLGALVALAFLLGSSPLGWIAIGMLAALAGVMLIFGAAAMLFGMGIKAAGEGFDTIVNAGAKLGALKDMDFSGLKRLGEAMQAFSNMEAIGKIDDNVIKSMKGLIEVVKLVGDSLGNIITAGQMALKHGGDMRRIFSVLFGPAGIMVSAITSISDNLVGFWGNKTIPDNVLKSMTGVIDVLNSFTKGFADMVVMGMMLKDAAVKNAAVEGISFATDQIILMVETISKKLSFRNIATNVQESIKTVFEMMNAFVKGFTDIAVIGIMVGDDWTSGIGLKFRTGMEFMANELVRTLTYLDSKLHNWYGNETIAKNVQDSILFILNLGKNSTDALIEMAALGSVMNSGMSADLKNYSTGLGVFLTDMMKVANGVDAKGLNKLGTIGEALTKVKAGFSNDISISARGGAEIALDAHESATREHQNRLEKLLTEIRDGIREGGTKVDPATVVTKSGNENWNPMSLFGDSNETF